MRYLAAGIFLIFYHFHLNAQVFYRNWNCYTISNIRSGSDANNADFTAGTFSNTIVTGSTVSLAVAATTGTFTSRTFDIFQSCIQFTAFQNFSWKTSLPFLKELPLTTENSTDYPSVLGTLQTNLIGYWRLNETTTGTAPGAKDFKDLSGNNNHATKTGTITLGATGLFLSGASSNNTAGYFDLTGVNTLIGNTSSYTMSLWFNLSTFTNGCGGAGTYLFDRAISGGGNPLAGICTKGSSYGFESRCDNGTSLQQVLGGAVVLNKWQNVVIQRDRAAALYRIFTDGVQVNTAADGGGCTVTLDPPRVGRHATGTNQGMTGTVDEIMIWNRALTAAEVAQVYRRGGNRLRFQFRACSKSDCSDNPTFVGPDGTASTYFSELYNNSVQSTGLGNVLTGSPAMTFSNFVSFSLTRNRYFQYRAYLDSNSTTTTPDFNYTALNW